MMLDKEKFEADLMELHFDLDTLGYVCLKTVLGKHGLSMDGGVEMALALQEWVKKKKPKAFDFATAFDALRDEFGEDNYFHDKVEWSLRYLAIKDFIRIYIDPGAWQEVYVPRRAT